MKTELLKNIRILFVTNDYWIGAKGYNLYKRNVANGEWSYFAKLDDSIYNILSKYSLTRRLLRAEIRHLYHYKGDNWFCIAKKGIFRLNKQTCIFEKSCHIDRGSRPMNLCQDDNGFIYFGEYFYNKKQTPVHIYKSIDNGLSWNIAYTFPKGEIGHIHGIQKDPFSNKLWITTGDIDNECLIGYSEDGFQTLKIILRGIQDYRACNLIFYPDKICFATDSQYQKNRIISFDRETFKVSILKIQLQGTGIYGGQNGAMAYISTTVEPSKINTDRYSYLWISKDGFHWDCILSYKKDIFKDTFFQFGSIRFPNYELPADRAPLIIEGRALEQLDGNSLIIDDLK